MSDLSSFYKNISIRSTPTAIRVGRRKPAARPERKVKYSFFLVTMNTNSVTYVRDDRMPKTVIYQRALDALRYKVLEMIKPNPRDPIASSLTIEELMGNIKSVELQSVIEIGEKQHRLHSHSLIRVVHTTNIHLDRDRILDFMNAQFRGAYKNGVIASPISIKYMNIKVVPAAVPNILKYFDKNQVVDLTQNTDWISDVNNGL